MTDIVGYIAAMVQTWNGDPEADPAIEPKCGLCWEFTAPIRESDLNEYKFRGDECCVLVALTDYRWECIAPMNRTTGLPQLVSEVYSFNLHFLALDNLGLNVYNEIPNHPLAESKWATILDPLADCIACSPLDFCEYLGQPLEVVRWAATPKIDWLDMNYTGWTINVQLRKNNVG